MTPDFSDRNAALVQPYAGHVATLRERYDAALERSGAAHAAIFSGAPRYAFQDDHAYPFKPNPHFVNWVPLTALPWSWIVYTPGEQPRLIYYQPRDYWHSVPGEPDGFWSRAFDIRVIREPEDAAEHLPEDRDKCILLGEIHDPAHAFGIERVNPTAATNRLFLDRGRKTAYELECMRLASRRAAAGHLAAEAAFREGLSEFGIHQAYCAAVAHTDSELPYGNIIALNEHGAVLHYTDLDREPPEEIRSFLIDAGAAVHGYTSDITRTYANGDARFAELIERMDDLQLSIVANVRADADFRDLHVETHRQLAHVLSDSGLASGDPDQLVASGVTSAFFPHGLGHLLGIQVHDVGGHLENESGATIDPPSGHRFLRLTRKLEEDMVVTIEPGLYVIDMLLENLRGTEAEQLVDWDAVDWLRPYGGIRIEDDVRVLADGAENLTRDAFAELKGD